LDEEAAISSQVVNRILFGHGERQRFTQETPILPEVWQLYAAKPSERQDLLITPLESTSAVGLLRRLLDDLPEETRREARFAPLQSFLAARLTFRELIRGVLPLTKWALDAWDLFKERKASAAFAEIAFDQAWDSARGRAGGHKQPLRGQMLEVARILTLTAVIYIAEEHGLEEIVSVEQLGDHRAQIVARIAELIGRLPAMAKAGDPLIWRIASNRPISLADEHSRATVKADAAFRLFDVRCGKIVWAVIDSGVDRDHPGFLCDPLDPKSGSRVIKTYDLSILRGLLDPAYDYKTNPMLEDARQRAGLSRADAQRHLRNLYQSYETEMLDWSSIEPLIAVEKPSAPSAGHGTHVAGIIGADMRAPDNSVIVRGLCPDIRIMDFRIVSDTDEDTEFAVIGALQLVRYLNSHNQYVVVHGANLSLSIPHVVESFACGRTPVCDECERLVGAGTTVVVAAGNYGHHKYLTDKGPFSGYATLSITDPGNAESVITVGATHRRDPHTYGISYFSSRGPTGDGRMKPDLVAPGERIESTLPGGEIGSLDGTSQAAPHVSAAAAMLMARYPELNRSPGRIKRLLCESATDLGRERAFQGHGLLDILRALQSF
jgi:serine protease AprX